MGWRTQDAYDRAAEEQWRSLPWQTRLRASARAWLVLGALIALLTLAFLAHIRPASAECVTVKYRDTAVCLDTFKCTDTARSSYVRTVCYDAAKSYMLIKLKNVWYHYCAVDSASAQNLITAPSVGRHYTEYFRSHKGVHGPFDCRDHPPPSYP
jgi:hypothetical protein